MKKDCADNCDVVENCSPTGQTDAYTQLLGGQIVNADGTVREGSDDGRRYPRSICSHIYQKGPKDGGCNC